MNLSRILDSGSSEFNSLVIDVKYPDGSWEFHMFGGKSDVLGEVSKRGLELDEEADDAPEGSMFYLYVNDGGSDLNSFSSRSTFMAMLNNVVRYDCYEAIVRDHLVSVKFIVDGEEYDFVADMDKLRDLGVLLPVVHGDLAKMRGAIKFARLAADDSDSI